MDMKIEDMPQVIIEMRESLKRIEEKVGASTSDAHHTDAEKPMSIKQVADYLRVGTGTIYQYIKRGAIPYFQVGGKKYFKKSEIDKALKVQ